jgi:predicted ATPase
MLKRIKIQNLRGIREGEIDGLTRLVVLVGPNGSGKSTVLEGAYLGGSGHPAEAVGMVVRRRANTWNGARWVVTGGDARRAVTVEVEMLEGSPRERQIRWDPLLQDAEAIKWFADNRSPGPYSKFSIFERGALVGMTAMAADNHYRVDDESDWELSSLRLVDATSPQPLHDLFTQAVTAGRREDIIEIARTVVPDLGGIEILTEDSEPRLCLTFRGGTVFVVPVSLAGDGIHALLRMAFELASPAGGTVLLEEPEVHMHPKASYACAKAIVAAVRRDVQVILTTHSLELIDLLLAELTEEERADPGMMTLCRVQLREGKLIPTLIPARDAVQARMALAEDLR